MEWLKWFVGATTDPKFAVIARRSKKNLASVIAVWAMLLERAGQADDRGEVEGFDCEGADIVLGLEDGAACSILQAMRDKGLITNGRITNWDKRQRRDEPEAVKERKRLQREREKLAAEMAAIEKARAELNEKSQGVTPRHATSQGVTNVTHKRREEKIRKENISPDSLENEEPARAREASQGSSTGKNPPPPPADEPGIEFVELRQFYSEHFRDEGTLAGFAEFKQARAGSQWPGFSRLYEHLNACLQCGQWEKGYAPGLARYFRERMWKDQAKPRASPQRTSPAKPGEFDPDRQAQIFRDVLADLEAEDARAGQATQAGGPVRLGPELRQGIPAASGATLDAPARAVQR